MKILVTGATGYIGGRLIPRLVAEGHDVTATVSSMRKPQRAPWFNDIYTKQMDVLDASQVRQAVKDVEAVYYLIHGMGGKNFEATDRQAASNMAQAVDAAGVKRLIYLSGIVPDVNETDLSAHIRSRLEVENILTASHAVTVTLRAAVIMGSGSTSFEIIRQVSERLPLQTVPDWMDSRVQPIAVVDVLEALLGALRVDTCSTHFDIGGPDVMPYSELLDRYSTIAGLTRPQVTVPFLPSDLVGTLVGALTDVPGSTVEALVESLRHDMVCADDRFTRLLSDGHRLVGFDDSIRRSLSTAPDNADPMSRMPQDPHWATGGEDRPLAARIADTVKRLMP